MESQSNSNKNGNLNPEGGRILGGVIIVLVGALLLARQVGTDFPHWLFSWPMFLIVLGIYIGVRHRFRNGGWIVPVLIGSVFLLDRMMPDLDFGHLAWPIVIIIAGLAMIFRKSRRDVFRRWDAERSGSPLRTSEGMIDTVVIFGEDKKQILSKDFKGGESVCVFGGVEINLMQADINGRVAIELVQVFGGTKLIVPAHWRIETEEVVSIFGGVNDKRHMMNSAEDDSKVLVLRGTSIFGGIDIKSF